MRSRWTNDAGDDRPDDEPREANAVEPVDAHASAPFGQRAGTTPFRPFLASFGGHTATAFAPPTGAAGTPARSSDKHLSSPAAGVSRVLLTCDDGNDASASIIERAGGVLEDIRVAPDGIDKRRYWIE